MKAASILALFAIVTALQGCGRDEPATAPEAAAPEASTDMPGMPGMTGAPAAETATYSTTGEVTAVTGESVTISHQAVQGLGWPAMTMAFKARDAAMLAAIQPGAQVAFSFRKEGDDYLLTEIERR
jgi:membrane fusion protein, copper/silver efflux system